MQVMIFTIMTSQLHINICVCSLTWLTGLPSAIWLATINTSTPMFHLITVLRLIKYEYSEVIIVIAYWRYLLSSDAATNNDPDVQRAVLQLRTTQQLTLPVMTEFNNYIATIGRNVSLTNVINPIRTCPSPDHSSSASVKAVLTVEPSNISSLDLRVSESSLSLSTSNSDEGVEDLVMNIMASKAKLLLLRHTELVQVGWTWAMYIIG